MGVKDFFRLNKKKVLFTVVLIVVLAVVSLSRYFIPSYDGFAEPFIYAFLNDLIKGIIMVLTFPVAFFRLSGTLRIIIMLIIEILYLYVLGCVIHHFFCRKKEINKERTSV